MAKLQLFQPSDAVEQDGYAGPCAASGSIRSKLLAPRDYPLWMCEATLAPGARLIWDGRQGDEGIYLQRGALQVGEQVCRAGGGLILEAGARVEAEALEESVIFHTGAWQVAEPRGRLVHVIGADGWYRSPNRGGVVARWLADSTCPTCNITYFHAVGEANGGSASAPHSHSADEIIHILEGHLFLGGRRFEAGASLCIPADTRYKLSGGDEPFAYLNYRPANATATRYIDGKASEPEEGHALALKATPTLDVIHLASATPA
ncbi:MAG: hypothetical protein JOZ39_03875 [Chloroflexi bacterium]|nr:hypothetical protein [Chloroflexota bacterium]